MSPSVPLARIRFPEIASRLNATDGAFDVPSMIKLAIETDVSTFDAAYWDSEAVK